MKFIQTINSSANKFAKGMVGIFAIKLMLFGGAFLIQSCQTDEIENTQNMEPELLRNLRLLTLDEKVESLNKLNNSLLEYVNFSKNIKMVSESSHVSLKESSHVSLKEKELISAAVGNSKSIFDYLGVNEKEFKNLINESGKNVSTDDIYIAFGLALISIYNKDNSLNASSHSGSDDSLKYSRKTLNYKIIQRESAIDCLMEATGVNALIALGDAAAALYIGEASAGWAVDAAAAAAYRKAAISAAKKIILRAAGGFGAIVMIVQFTNCMM